MSNNSASDTEQFQTPTPDLLIFTPENLLLQATSSPIEMGYHQLNFYVEKSGQLAKEPTDYLAKFYYSPSGGTLRDSDMNIVTYSAKYDKFKGYGARGKNQE